MAQDRHVGRSSPTFVVKGNPDSFIGLINRHGIFARIMRARKCPCSGPSGTPSILCELCRGDGSIYDFQRKLLQSDEDCDVRGDRSTVYPFRVPVLDVQSVERLLPPEQGGIQKYFVETFDSLSIKISGNPLPLHWQKLRVSYWFDRYNESVRELADVDQSTKILTMTGTVFDDGHATGNVKRAAGDITIVTRIYDKSLDHVFQNFTFAKNRIYLADSEPTPTPGQVEVSYFYAPPARVLVADLDQQEKQERWITEMRSGITRMSVEPWYEMSSGDLITLLVPEFVKEEVIQHTNTGIDRLLEFDVSRMDDVIFDESGREYRQGTDFVLKHFRDLHWIGSQPPPGRRVSVRYSYHPTYVIFMDQAAPNTLENRQYPKTFMAHLWGKTLAKDVEIMRAPVY